MSNLGKGKKNSLLKLLLLDDFKFTSLKNFPSRPCSYFSTCIFKNSFLFFKSGIKKIVSRTFAVCDGIIFFKSHIYLFCLSSPVLTIDQKIMKIITDKKSNVRVIFFFICTIFFFYSLNNQKQKDILTQMDILCFYLGDLDFQF